MSEKSTKKEANYRVGNQYKHCADCTMFRPPNACTAVEGNISPSGLCDYFKRKESA